MNFNKCFRILSKEIIILELENVLIPLAYKEVQAILIRLIQNYKITLLVALFNRHQMNLTKN